MQVSDIWGPVTPPIVNGQHFNTWLAAKRALYIVLQHAELAVDMVVEEDIGPTLNTYRMIVLADTHVSKKGASALAAWVAAGGVLFATAGAGAFDELVRSPTSTGCQLLAFPRSLPPSPTHSYLFASAASSSQWLIGHTPMMAARRLRQNQTNPVMAKLLGVGASHGTYEP
eukprot:COSAG01_NODE_4723_length_4791_cov_2.785806_3_plen_171_part_00